LINFRLSAEGRGLGAFHPVRPQQWTGDHGEHHRHGGHPGEHGLKQQLAFHPGYPIKPGNREDAHQGR
jgi:hypothetical protein